MNGIFALGIGADASKIQIAILTFYVHIFLMRVKQRLLNQLYELRYRLSGRVAGLRMFAAMLPEHPDQRFILCSECFQNHGLKLDARYLGASNHDRCPNCGSTIGRKLNSWALGGLATRFFHWGTMVRCEYGAELAVVGNQTARIIYARMACVSAYREVLM